MDQCQNFDYGNSRYDFNKDTAYNIRNTLLGKNAVLGNYSALSESVCFGIKCHDATYHLQFSVLEDPNDVSNIIQIFEIIRGKHLKLIDNGLVD